MSLNAATIEYLLEKGLTGKDLLAVAQRMERRADPTAAERMARHRAKRATRNVTRNAPPIEEDHTPPEVTTKPSGLEPKPKKHRLPDDWQPRAFNPGTAAFEIVQRWEPGRLERELAKFRAHYAAAGTKWENWQAVWCKWANNSEDFQRGRNNGGNHQHPGLGKTSAAIAGLGDWNDDRPM